MDEVFEFIDDGLQMSLLVSGHKGWETKFMDCQVSLIVHWDVQKDSMDHPFVYTLSIEEVLECQ